MISTHSRSTTTCTGTPFRPPGCPYVATRPPGGPIRLNSTTLSTLVRRTLPLFPLQIGENHCRMGPGNSKMVHFRRGLRLHLTTGCCPVSVNRPRHGPCPEKVLSSVHQDWLRGGPAKSPLASSTTQLRFAVAKIAQNHHVFDRHSASFAHGTYCWVSFDSPSRVGGPGESTW